MRLIDVEDLKEVFKEKSTEAVLGADLCKAIIAQIDSKQTVEAEPVRHGHWVVHTDKWASGDEYFGYAECSECGDMFYAVETIGIKPIWDYCPSCGAKMDEEEEE